MRHTILIIGHQQPILVKGGVFSEVVPHSQHRVVAIRESQRRAGQCDKHFENRSRYWVCSRIDGLTARAEKGVSLVHLPNRIGQHTGCSLFEQVA
jgi:hypothetical protein